MTKRNRIFVGILLAYAIGVALLMWRLLGDIDPRYRESAEESLTAFGVQRALMNGLRRAQDWGMTSLALPPLGLGAGSLEPDEVAGMVVEVLLHQQSEGGPPEDVVIVVESTYEEELFRRLLAAAQP